MAGKKMRKPINKSSILVVDDAPDTLEIVKRNLTSHGYEVFTANSVDNAIEFLDINSVDLVITDLRMPKVSGLDLVRHVRANMKDTEIIMITGYATIDGAVKAIKIGAEEYLSKPFTDEELLNAVQCAINKLRARKTIDNDVGPITSPMEGIIGESAKMQHVYKAVFKAATTIATVLITGESGTGKELVARAIHYNSNRASAPFVPINCGGIPEGLLESELFGHVKGAFTGATESRAGFFQTAEGGTVFLDEIGEMSLAMQVKLLRVLQDKEITMVGAGKSRNVDVRILAATNKELRQLVTKGSFREDLYFRLGVLTIDVPPISERENDILLLCQHNVTKFAKESGKVLPKFTDRALNILKNYSWPGNVREIENLIQRLIVMTDNDLIDAPDLPSFMRFSVSKKAGLNKSLTQVEYEHIKNVLANVGGNKTKAAEILGIDRKTLREKLKQTENK
ncbi:MAG: sigma-54-dependent Fis family transcriptional regulator [candidate division Zixibacteria bacterium]|nr:sigma-54-dependent Fis family transcriptional regulator [candidate division Zixibacteria bacterium]